ncbi:hypothetical protein ABEF94_013528 [Exophiala dermatitidis]
MKVYSVTFFALLALAGVHAQSSESESLPPSPTESVGCSPHGDHWHCSAPATATDAAVTATTASASEDPGPSPTESVGCEPHGDHWHCDGPAVTSAPASSSAAAPAATTAATTANEATTGSEDPGAAWTAAEWHGMQARPTWLVKLLGERVRAAEGMTGRTRLLGPDNVVVDVLLDLGVQVVLFSAGAQ